MAFCGSSHISRSLDSHDFLPEVSMHQNCGNSSFDLGLRSQVSNDVVGKRDRVDGHNLRHAKLKITTVPLKVSTLTTETPVIAVGVFGAAGQGNQREDERSQGGLPDERGHACEFEWKDTNRKA